VSPTDQKIFSLLLLLLLVVVVVWLFDNFPYTVGQKKVTDSPSATQ
jgi:hypothetical protein